MCVLAAFAGFAAVSDGSDATDPVVIRELTGDDVISTGIAAEYKYTFTESAVFSSISITYTAELVYDGDTVTSGVSPSSGSLTSGTPVTLKVASQSDAGTYTLKVTVTETVTDEDSQTVTYEYNDSKKIKVMEPIKLTVSVENTGAADLYNGKVVFYLDGELIEGSETDVSVKAGATTDVSYSYLPDGLSSGKHTYYIEATDGSVIQGIGADNKVTFYYEDGNYDWINYLMVVLIVVMLLLLVWVFRKPVKNFGKPKSRR
ncbi:MAG: hypothetical protein E7Z63_04870 [Thermoplasmata archaeon]|nr:hypothetical protein [Thermoplasmata archaeon]